VPRIKGTALDFASSTKVPAAGGFIQDDFAALKIGSRKIAQQPKK
jgi:hypothetical protein